MSRHRGNRKKLCQRLRAAYSLRGIMRTWWMMPYADQYKFKYWSKSWLRTIAQHEGYDGNRSTTDVEVSAQPSTLAAQHGQEGTPAQSEGYSPTGRRIRSGHGTARFTEPAR